MLEQQKMIKRKDIREALKITEHILRLNKRLLDILEIIDPSWWGYQEDKEELDEFYRNVLTIHEKFSFNGYGTVEFLEELKNMRVHQDVK